MAALLLPSAHCSSSLKVSPPLFLKAHKLLNPTYISSAQLLTVSIFNSPVRINLGEGPRGYMWTPGLGGQHFASQQTVKDKTPTEIETEIKSIREKVFSLLLFGNTTKILAGSLNH